MREDEELEEEGVPAETGAEEGKDAGSSEEKVPEPEGAG